MHDRQCSRAPAAANWTCAVPRPGREPQRYAPYDQKRHEFMALVQGGRAPEALEAWDCAAPGAGRDAGDRHAILDRRGFPLVRPLPRGGRLALGKAAQQAQAAHPYQAAGLLLLLSDAQRRAGQTGSAEATWQGAAQLAAELAAAPVPVSDPILWERIAYLRPANDAWPPAVEQRIRNSTAGSGSWSRPGQRPTPSAADFARRSRLVDQYRSLAAGTDGISSRFGGVEASGIHDQRPHGRRPARTLASQGAR